MSEKEQYQQKLQAQLDEWKAEIDKLKAKASDASADAKLEMDKQIENLEEKVKEGNAKLSELSEASDDSWEKLKGNISSTWDSIKSAFSDAASKFKKK